MTTLVRRKKQIRLNARSVVTVEKAIEKLQSAFKKLDKSFARVKYDPEGKKSQIQWKSCRKFVTY